MAKYKIQIISDTAPRTKAVPYPGFVETPSIAGGSVYAISGVTIDADHFIDVWIDGWLQDLTAWTANVGANTVTLSESLPAGRSVRIRVYLH